LFEPRGDLRLVGEPALCVTEVENEVAPRPGRHQVGVRIAIHVRDDSGLGELVRMIDQGCPPESTSAPVPQDACGPHHDQIQQAVLVQVVEQDRMNSREPAARGELEENGLLEGDSPRAHEQAQRGGVDLGGNGIPAIVATIGPPNRQLAFDDDAAAVGSLGQVERNGNLRPGGRFVRGGKEAGVMPLGLDESVAGARESLDELSPVVAPQCGEWRP